MRPRGKYGEWLVKTARKHGGFQAGAAPLANWELLRILGAARPCGLFLSRPPGKLTSAAGASRTGALAYAVMQAAHGNGPEYLRGGVAEWLKAAVC